MNIYYWNLFIIIISLLLISLQIFLWKKMIKDTQLHSPKVNKIVFGFIFTFAPILFFHRWLVNNGVTHYFFLPLFSWLGVSVALSLYFLCTDIFTKFISLTKFILIKKTSSPLIPNTERRIFLKRSVASAGIITASTLQAVGMQEALDPKIKTVDVHLKNLPNEFENFKIVQITDLHVSSLIRRDFVQNVVDLSNSLNADMIALTGDFVDGSISELEKHIEPLKDLKSRYGTFYVTGNHEFYHGADHWCDHFTQLGFKLLRNKMEIIDSGRSILQISGIEDWASKHFGAGPDLSRALASVTQEFPTLLLSHQPMSFNHAVRNGVDLQLSGHTHGGQIWPVRYLVSLVTPYVRGLYQVGGSFCYVSCGTGYWGPTLRIGAPAEITLINLKRASS